jgi:hypothetical protein
MVGGIAALAYTLRDQVDPARREEAEQAATNPAPAQPAPDAKITSRLGTPAGQPPPPSPSDASQQIAVAQRATLLLEVPGATDQVPRSIPGRVVWSFENLPSQPGKPLDPALVGTVEVPDAGFSLKLQMTRNRDKSLPASYLMFLVFTTKESPVKDVTGVLMKADEAERGAFFTGILQSLGPPNLFVLALSADETDIAKNFELLKKRAWFNVRFRLADDRLGAIVFEKGVAGDRALLASMDAWK